MALFTTIILATLVSLGTNWLMESQRMSMTLVPNFLRLKLVANPHIAFGIALPNTFESLLITGALILVIWMALKAADTLSRIAFGLILGGAIANILDRLPDGIVTDYIAVGTFPVFNMADICITIGAGLLLLEGMRKTPKD